MKISKFAHSAPAKHVLGRDAYDMAKEWNCTPAEAAKRMLDEGWFFAGYNDFGEESYLSPKEEAA
jgi:hypothetical protein